MSNFTIDLFIGLFMFGFGFYTAYLRLSGNSEKLTKLQKFKSLINPTIANIIHLIFYTLFPLIFGMVILIALSFN